jgi:hypothetical protein
MTVAAINNKDELQKLLAIQTIITSSAMKEIAAWGDPTDPAKFIAYVAKVLEKYARYATLTEYKIAPNLADSEKWGATFGVTAIIGKLVLEQAAHLLTVDADLRLEYLNFLARLDEPKSVKLHMNALNRIFAVLSESYGIIWTKDDTISLTVVGRRVYLHLLDAMKFVDDVTEATQKFQES